MVLDIETAARAVVMTAAESLSPRDAHVRHECLRMRLMSRGEGYASSRWLQEAEVASAASSLVGVSVLVCDEDKSRRKDVLYFLPQESLVFPGRCPLQADFVKPYAGMGFNYRDYSATSGPKASVLNTAACWSVMASGAPKPASRSKAFSAAGEVAVHLTGRSESELKASGLTGTHVSRHLAETVKWAQWDATPKGAAQADILGDWATQSGASADPSKQASSRPSARKSYKPNSTLKEQVEARSRFARLLQAAFTRFGTENVVDTTTWPELLPDAPPPELADFYGEQGAYVLSSVLPDAALPGVTFSQAAPSKRPRRSS